MKLQVEYVPIGSIKPYDKNAKTHPQEQIEQIKRSMQEFGNIDPVGIWHGEIVEGHGRYEAAKQLGYTELPVIRLDDLTDEQRRAYALVHNKLAMNSPFDIDILEDELASIGNIDMSELGFDLDFDDGSDFFSGDRSGQGKQDGNDEYNEFVEKFEEKHTTDDCYTPDNIYEAVLNICIERYNINPNNVVRPFYPGGDFEKFPYKNESVVIDNPPFSILSRIVKFYLEKNIRFFLFAPALTMMGYANRCCCICTQNTIIYENGAQIATSFLTNMEQCRAKSDPGLYAAITKANKENLKKLHKDLPTYEYPKEVVTSSKLAFLSHYGVSFEISSDESIFIRELDAQKEKTKSMYGGALLLSEAQAQAQAQAQQERERTDVVVWELSDREKELVKSLAK